MPTAQASRCLQQLRKLWAHKFAVDFSPEQGRIDTGEWRKVSMTAASDLLTVRVEAADKDLPRLRQVVQNHIARFAFRETLAFDWQPA